MKFKFPLLTVIFSLITLSSCDFTNNKPTEPDVPDTPVIPDDPDTVLVESITLNSSTLDLPLKTRQKIISTVYPSNATNKAIEWISNDTSIATVDKNGYVYGAKVGSTFVTAKAKDGSNVYATCNINVFKNEVTSITLSKNKLDLHVNDSESITYSLLPNDATNKDVTISSSNEEVATVTVTNNTLLIKALSIGTSLISVTSKDNSEVYDECEINVTPIKVTGISFRKSKLYVNVNSDNYVKAIVSPSNATNQEVNYVSNNPDFIDVDSLTGKLNVKKAGTAIITATSIDGGFTATIEIVSFNESSLVKTTLPYTAKDVKENNIYNVDACPSNGNPKLLIVPVWFEDSFYFIDDRDTVRSDIEKAYLGTNEEVGWRSVKTYYEELSHNSLSIQGVVTDWYNTGMSYTAFMDEVSGGDKTTNLVNQVVSDYKNKTGDNMTSFDYDKNGYIDGVILIYAAPDYYALGKGEYYDTSEYSNLWAYCYWVSQNKKNVNNPNPNVFFWASYDFMYSSGEYAQNKTNRSSYGNGDTSHQNIDTHTFIHEMGHVLGLEDYYDYAGKYNPAGGFSMQDYNVGSHDPYSAMALGFVDPYVIEDTTIITINSFQESGDLLLISDSFNDSPFDEYFLVELYSPTGLNEFDSLNQYSGYYPLGPSKCGIRLWHVDTRLLYATSSYSRYLNKNQITTNPWIDGYKVDYLMTNSFATSMEHFSDYVDYMALQLIRNNKTVSYKNSDDITNNDLFLEGDKFDMYDYYNQFVNKSSYSSKKGALDSGNEFPFTIEISQINEDKATIKVTKK